MVVEELLLHKVGRTTFRNGLVQKQQAPQHLLFGQIRRSAVGRGAIWSTAA